MRKLRWIVYAPAALIAFFASPVAASEFITWTCQAETSWQMQQPLADYEAGLFPQWSDCEAWRDGEPAEGWQWSYGAGVATTTSSSSTVAVTSTVPLSTTSSLPEESSTSTTEQPATTVETTTTTSQAVPTEQPIPQTSSWVEPTEDSTTTTVEPTTTTPATTTASSIPVLPSSSLPPALESSVPRTTTPEVFFSPAPPSSLLVLTAEEVPSADASEEEREAFEEQVNIFDGSFDDYVPVGSKITVAERRTIVAASTILLTLPTPSASRRRT